MFKTELVSYLLFTEAKEIYVTGVYCVLHLHGTCVLLFNKLQW